MINLTDLKAKAEGATSDWPHRTSEADAAYIAAASPADMLPLINALIEWRDAYQAWSSADSAARLGLASDALFALIGGEPTQETTP